MGRKIDVYGDLFDEDVVAFVRKLKKSSKGKTHVMQLKADYCLDMQGMVHSIFLEESEAIKVIDQFKKSEEEHGRKARSPGVAGGKVGKGTGAFETAPVGEARVSAVGAEDD